MRQPFMGAKLVLAGCLGCLATVMASPTRQPACAAPLAKGISAQRQVPGDEPISIRLAAGQTVEVSARIASPSTLPDNGRLRVTWRLAKADDPQLVPRAPGESGGRDSQAFGIYQTPTPDWSKVLHALDADLFTLYQAPVAGEYQLVIAPEEGELPTVQAERWREKGHAPDSRPIPLAVRWPAGQTAQVEVAIRPVDTAGAAAARLFLEAEPNDTPEQAQPLTIPAADKSGTIKFHVVGGADDIEYFDNGAVGASGDDWFRIEFAGKERRLLTACLSIPDQQVAAQIRCYRLDPKAVESGQGAYLPGGPLLPIVEYDDGKNPNERSHQQEEQHRIAVNRWLDPAGVYFLRVEANAPGYELELCVVEPAPYTDPQVAIRRGMYDHIGQVDAWLTNRPRGASIDRRIRDSGNVLGTNCMSCHTQSGVWGPAVPMAFGYRAENVQLWRHLINTCYQSLRPTNELKDAANNTSLRPFDLGDGPAGTRVAGHAVAAVERVVPPRKLHGKQALRTANFVVLTGDPGGINAAGPGANVGQGVVFNYAGEILFTAWNELKDPKYFHKLTDKAERMLKINVKFTDDLGHRLEFFHRYFPKDYVAQVEQVGKTEGLEPAALKTAVDKAKDLQQRIDKQVAADIARLRAIQHTDGSWSFDPGETSDDGKKWTVKDRQADPSPTALAIIGLEAAGFGLDDKAVAAGVKSLLALQQPTGYWKVQSQTGFVSTSYALHALSRLYPTEPPVYQAKDYQPGKKETLAGAIRRVRDMSVTGEPAMVPLLIEAARHDSPLVRYWAMIGLGALPSDAGAPVLAAGLSDRAKLVREAAHWGLRQNLIDDRGWEALFAAVKSSDDYTREAALQALFMEVDAVMPASRVGWDRLNQTLAYSLNEDPHPGVRAWATRAAWQWWLWNPPVRKSVNAAWVKLLTRPEPNLVVENAIRYQSHALFVTNGHVANATKEHQYKELGELFETLYDRLLSGAESDADTVQRLSARLVDVAGTYYSQRGGDGGPGQLGYSTPGAGRLFGNAVKQQLKHVEQLPAGERRDTLLQVALEGAANIPLESLQEVLIDYSLNGPEQFRGLAAASISDPRLVSLIAVPEQLEPMYRQLLRGAAEPDRRKNLSDPILNMYGGVHWILPNTREQRDEILQYIIPDTSGYLTPEQIKQLDDNARHKQAERESDAHWYLAEGLGAALAQNEDLHFDALAEAFPERFENAAQARFWLRSVSWILAYKQELPDVKQDPKALPPIDPYEELRTRALSFFLSQLSAEADPRNRAEAVNLANGTNLRRNPEILTALEQLASFEKDKGVLDRAEKVLSQGRGNFLKDLADAIKKEPVQQFPTKGGTPQPPEDFTEDFIYFRDYVVPEMSKVLRGDQRSCMICHGEPGRVPSLQLNKPDEVGYLPVDQLLGNYRLLQQRIDTSDVERSKLLRKPLNVQDGEEDGHQGGRRYQPSDPGYQVLRKWALNQIEIQKKYGMPGSNKTGE